MSTYAQFDNLVSAVRELDRARTRGEDARGCAARVEMACLALVDSAEMHRRRELLRANLIVEEHFERLKQTGRENP